MEWYLPLVINNAQTSPAQSAWVICSNLSTFTLHLPISILNDGLFLNGPWLMMSNPKIPSNTMFVLSYSRATSFHSCLPCFTLTGTACLLPRRQRDWRGLTSTPLSESQCQETTRWRRTAKGKGAVTPCGRPSHSSTPPPPLTLLPPLSCIYANSLCWERTQRMTCR